MQGDTLYMVLARMMKKGTNIGMFYLGRSRHGGYSSNARSSKGHCTHERHATCHTAHNKKVTTVCGIVMCVSSNPHHTTLFGCGVGTGNMCKNDRTGPVLVGVWYSLHPITNMS